MALMGKAALAMWWEIEATEMASFADWHAHEHFPERLAIPGFRRASRWHQAGGGDGVFVVYELDGHEVLSSEAYLSRLNAPTPWSRQMMPLHRHMVRCQCEVLASHGALSARWALTLRLSAQSAAHEDGLRAALASRVGKWPARPGLTGAHLLRHRAPAIAATTEQKIRGGDGEADWVLVVCGYDRSVLDALADGELSREALAACGADDMVLGRHELAYTAVPSDMA